MYTSLTRKAGFDICPLPADIRDSCFRGGVGAIDVTGASECWGLSQLELESTPSLLAMDFSLGAYTS